MPDTPFGFGLWLYQSFVEPLFHLCQTTTILGFSLFSWLMGLSLLALGVRFVRVLFGASGDNDRG